MLTTDVVIGWQMARPPFMEKFTKHESDRDYLWLDPHSFYFHEAHAFMDYLSRHNDSGFQAIFGWDDDNRPCVRVLVELEDGEKDYVRDHRCDAPQSVIDKIAAVALEFETRWGIELGEPQVACTNS